MSAREERGARNGGRRTLRLRLLGDDLADAAEGRAGPHDGDGLHERVVGVLDQPLALLVGVAHDVRLVAVAVVAVQDDLPGPRLVQERAARRARAKAARTVTSTFTMSPRCSARPSGTPWQTTSLTEVHTDLGKS
eukprot:scaffold1328_cov394-Prasinococcus_capsulatus_cf.AAC.54